MLKMRILILFCLLAPLISSAQHEIVLPSLTYSNRAGGSRIEQLIKLADDYRKSGEQAKLIETEKKLIDICHKKKDFYLEAKAWQDLGATTPDLIFAQICYKKAQLFFEKAGDKIAAIAALKEFADNYKKRNELDSATAVLKDVIRQYQQIGYKKLQFTYDLIASIANIQGRLNDELTNRIACIKSMEASGDFSNAALYYEGLSYDYWMFRKYPESLTYAQKCLSRNDRGQAYSAMGFAVTSLLALKRPDEALVLLQKASKQYPPAKKSESDLINTEFNNINKALKKDYKTTESNEQALANQTELMAQMAVYYHNAGYDWLRAQIEKQIIPFYHARNDLGNEAKAWLAVGSYSSNLIYCNTCLHKALQLFKQTGDSLDEIYTQGKIGINVNQQGKTDSANNILTQVVQRYRANSYDKDLFDIYNELAGIATQKGRINEALYYRLAAVKDMEANGKTENLAFYYDYLSQDYFNLRRTKEALYYEQKVFKLEGKNFLYGQASRIVFSLLNLKRPTEALAFLQNLSRQRPPVSVEDKKITNYEFGAIYTDLYQDKKAEEYYLQSIKFEKLVPPSPKDHGAFGNYLSIHTVIIQFFAGTKRYQKARYYLNYLPDSLDKYIAPTMQLFLDRSRFQVDSAFGNYISAIRHYQRCKILSDSLYNVKSISDAEEQQIKYDRDKKDRAIKMLQSEQRIQRMTTQKAVLQRNLTLAAIIIALLLTGIIYSSYRRKMLSGLIISKKNNQLQILLTDKEQTNLQINEKNNQLELLISEKDWLLKEVHHRVKNNLHTVFSLLESQARYLTDDALKAVEVSQHRIYAMSLIHQKLYQSDDIKTVDISLYLSEFIGYLIESFDTDNRIRFNLNIASITLDITQAIPVALIINEAVTNAIKYAFPDGKNGIISISFQQYDDDLTLKVIDNGVGIDSVLDLAELNSLGLILMQGLTGDLHGTFSIKNEQGTNIEIVFPAAAGLVE